MARMARVVAPGRPHHVTQRGNRRQQTFFGEDDYLEYKRLMARWWRRCCGCMPDWRAYLSGPEDEEVGRLLRRHESAGRPLGDERFVERREKRMGKRLRPRKPGPKPKRKRS